MFILAFIINTALAATPSEGGDCGPALELTDDRGADFYDRIATAAAAWYQAAPDPRRPQVRNFNLIEVRRGKGGDGRAIVELDTTLGPHRFPVLVHVRYTRNQITEFTMVDRGFFEPRQSKEFLETSAENAAMAKFLMSTDLPVKKLTAKNLSAIGSFNELSEVLVSASINKVTLEKIYVVISNTTGVVRVDESGMHRYPDSVLAQNFERLLLGPRKDPTLRITSIKRKGLHSWRVLYSVGSVERVDETERPRSTSEMRPANQIKIRPTGNIMGRAVFRGDGLTPRSKVLRVDSNHQFQLTDDSGLR